MKTLLSAVAALAFVAVVPAQQASFQTYGSGCPILGQTPAIGNNGLPRIGTRFDITYTGPNFTFNSAQQRVQPVLILGFAQVSIPVPPAILRQQPPNCFVLASPDFAFPMQTDPTQPVFASSLTLAVPNDPALVGFLLFGQWLALFEQCGFAGCNLEAAVSSDGAAILIGN